MDLPLIADYLQYFIDRTVIDADFGRLPEFLKRIFNGRVYQGSDYYEIKHHYVFVCHR